MTTATWLRSQEIARRLVEVQTGVNPAGLLLVASVDVGAQTGVALMKLEREEGVQYTVHEAGGHTLVDLRLLQQLTLTNKTKVFKTALLTLSDPDDPSSVDGLVSDDQRGQREGAGVADFFLRTFLGCTPAQNAGRITADFAHAAIRFINDDVASPEAKGRYAVSLLAELDNNTLDLHPGLFASRHLAGHDRDRFLAAVRAEGLDPSRAFPKDTSTVRTDNLRVTFESGIVMVSTREAFDEHVTVRPDDADQPGLEINDPIKSLDGR